MRTNNSLPPQVLQTQPFIVSCWINEDPVHLVTVNLIITPHSLVVDVIVTTLVSGTYILVCVVVYILATFLREVKY